MYRNTDAIAMIEVMQLQNCQCKIQIYQWLPNDAIAKFQQRSPLMIEMQLQMIR